MPFGAIHAAALLTAQHSSALNQLERAAIKSAHAINGSVILERLPESDVTRPTFAGDE